MSRYRIASIKNSHHTDHNLIDLTTQKIICTTRSAEDAQLVADALNAADKLQPIFRALIASTLGDFRLHLEAENNGPLLSDPDLAFFLADFCAYFHLNTGETSVALGGPLLAYLNRIDTESTVPVEDLAVNR